MTREQYKHTIALLVLLQALGLRSAVYTKALADDYRAMTRNMI